jgi:hypothetical protein
MEFRKIGPGSSVVVGSDTLAAGSGSSLKKAVVGSEGDEENECLPESRLPVHGRTFWMALLKLFIFHQFRTKFSVNFFGFL